MNINDRNNRKQKHQMLRNIAFLGDLKRNRFIGYLVKFKGMSDSKCEAA